MKAEDYRQVGRKALADYYTRYCPFDQSQTLSLEAQVFIALDDAEKYRLRGFIDRLAQRHDGTYEIHDYKTAGYLMTQKAADTDRQLALYQIGIEGMWDDVRNVDLIWHFVRFDKEIRSRRSAEQLNAVKAQCIGVIKDIEARGQEAASFPTVPTGLCDWCDYRELCPATKHYVAVASLPPKRYKADAGVQLVDRWATLCDQRLALEEQASQIKAEEEAVQQEVLVFAEQQGLQSVAGSSCHADILEKATLDYPRAGDDCREGFEEALHQAGVWNDVVTINGQRLKSLWLGDEELPSKARKLLEPFIKETNDRRAKLKKGGVEKD
jgi:putative RecB family exonuclease